MAPLLCLCSLAAVAGQTPCPANSAGEGDGTPCICDEGYDGSIEYNDAETPPVYEGKCSPVDANYFLGMGTGLLMSVILLAVSILAFNVASKTSFQCSMYAPTLPANRSDSSARLMAWRALRSQDDWSRSGAFLVTVRCLRANRATRGRRGPGGDGRGEPALPALALLSTATNPLASASLVPCSACLTGCGVLAQIDVVWWPRFVLSILLYAGTAVAVLAYIKDVVFFTTDRKTRVVIR